MVVRIDDEKKKIQISSERPAGRSRSRVNIFWLTKCVAFGFWFIVFFKLLVVNSLLEIRAWGKSWRTSKSGPVSFQAVTDGQRYVLALNILQVQSFHQNLIHWHIVSHHTRQQRLTRDAYRCEREKALCHISWIKIKIKGIKMSFFFWHLSRWQRYFHVKYK